MATNPQDTIETLRGKLVQLKDAAQVIQNTADAEKRDLSDLEKQDVSQIFAQFSDTEAEIDRREKIAALDAKLSAPQPRLTEPGDLRPQSGAQTMTQLSARGHTTITGGDYNGVTSKGAWGWRSIGEFAKGAQRAKAGLVDPRIQNAPATFGSEGTNADGGYAVPPDFRAEIMKLVLSEASLLSRTDQQVTSSKGITLPTDSSTPWQTSGGVLGGWVAEGADITLSKPALGQLTVNTNKLAALVPVTDELLEDVNSLSRYLTTKVPEKFNSLLNTAIVAGTGTGQPQGLLNSASKVTQAAEAGQGAGTIVAKNIVNMWSRLYAPLRQDAVWLINQDCERQLLLLAMPGTAPQVPLYMPPGGLSAAPFATIMGRPVIPVEACSALGTEGDIILTSLSSYLSVLKSGGLRQDVSIHLYFNSDHTAFRFVMRVGGQSYWSAALARQNGSNTLSNIITLNSTRT